MRPLGRRDGNADTERSAVGLSGLEAQPPAERGDPLAHAEQAHAGLHVRIALEIAGPAIIVDREHDFAAAAV